MIRLRVVSRVQSRLIAWVLLWFLVAVLGLAAVTGAAQGDLDPEAGECWFDTDRLLQPGEHLSERWDLLSEFDACFTYSVFYYFEGEAGQVVEVEVYSRTFPLYVQVNEPYGPEIDGVEYWDDFDNASLEWFSIGLFALPYTGGYEVEVVLESDEKPVGEVTVVYWMLSDRDEEPADVAESVVRLPMGEWHADALDGGAVRLWPDVGPGQVYRIEGRAGQSLWLRLFTGEPELRMLPYLRLMDRSGSVLAENDDGSWDGNAQLVAELPEDGWYFVHAGSASGFAAGARFHVRVDDISDSLEAWEGFLTHSRPSIDYRRVTAPDHITYAWLRSDRIDPLLRMRDADDVQLGEDDDSGGGYNSLLAYRAPEAQTLTFEASSFSGLDAGPFTLHIWDVPTDVARGPDGQFPPLVEGEAFIPEPADCWHEHPDFIDIGQRIEARLDVGPLIGACDYYDLVYYFSGFAGDIIIEATSADYGVMLFVEDWFGELDSVVYFEEWVDGVWVARADAVLPFDDELYAAVVSVRLTDEGVPVTGTVTVSVQRSGEHSSSADEPLEPAVDPPGEWLFTLSGHIGWVSSVAISPDGRRAVTGGIDRTARLWDLDKGVQVTTFAGPDSFLWAVAYSPDGRLVAGGGATGEPVFVWAADTGAVRYTLEGHEGIVMDVAFSPSGRYLASGSTDGSVRLWNVQTGALERVLIGYEGGVYALAFSPDGRLIAAGGQGGGVHIWDAVTGVLERTLQAHTESVNGLAFSHDGTRLVSGSTDQTVRLWDVHSGANVQTFPGHSGIVQTVGYAPSGLHVISGSADETIAVWDVTNGELVSTLTPHAGGIRDLAFSRDGSRLASASMDGTVQIWAPLGTLMYDETFADRNLGSMWSSGGDAPWTWREIEGPGTSLNRSPAMRSGRVDNNQSTELTWRIGLEEPAILGFWMRVSTEEGYDFLRLLVNGDTREFWSGEMPWKRFELPLAAGDHVITWRYEKDPSFHGGQDAAWITGVQVRRME